MSQDPAMVEAFKHGEDIHASTAAKVLMLRWSEVTREQRSQAKTVNFGIIYGVSAFGLADQANISRKEAKALIDAYYETYPTLKAYIEKQVGCRRDQGFCRNIDGSRRYLNRYRFEKCGCSFTC